MFKPGFGLRVFQENLFWRSKIVITCTLISLAALVILVGLDRLILEQTLPERSAQDRLLSSFPQLRDQIENPQKLTFATRSLEGNIYNGLEAATIAENEVPSLKAFFPENYQKPFVFEANGIKAVLSPSGANPAGATGTGEEGLVVYREAYPGTDSLQMVSGGQSKEFLLLRDKTAPSRFEYSLTIPAGNLARLDGGSLLIAGSTGEGLRILTPWLVDGRGQKYSEESIIRWELNDPPVIGVDGAQTLTLILTLIPDNLTYPLAIDPTWTATHNMARSHYFHTATKLQGGRVLIVGGAQGSCGCNTNVAEVFDPATLNWYSTANTLPQAIDLQTAILLQNGEVLVAGGSLSGGTALTSALIYNPGTNKWRNTGSMNGSHSSGSAVLLNDGRVLVYGGVNSLGQKGFTAEIYNPKTGTWSLTTSPVVQDEQNGAGLVVLANGKVLFSGAIHTIIRGTGYAIVNAEPEIYDPQSQTWTELAPNDLKGGQGFLLNDGRVIFATGEVFNPATNSVTQIAGVNSQLHRQGGAALLPDGRLMVTGGNTNESEYLVDIYDPFTMQAYSTPNLLAPRSVHTATTLNDGRVLVAGGISAGNSAEVYNPNAISNTSLRLSFSTSPAFIGMPVTITANIDYSGGATGNIIFKDGAAVLGTVPVTGGSASLSLPALGQGNHTISAVFSGDSRLRGSTAPTQTLAVIPPNLTLTLTAFSPHRYSEATRLEVAFTTAGAGGTCDGTVVFKQAGIVVETQPFDCNTPYFYPTEPDGSPLMVGTYSFTAEYSGGYGRAPAKSNTAQVIIPKLETAILWDTYWPYSPTIKSALGLIVPLKAKVYDYYGYDPRLPLPPFSGTLSITDNLNSVGTVPVNSDGTAQVNLANLGVGTHAIKAVYSGNDKYLNNSDANTYNAYIEVAKGSSEILIDSLTNAALPGQVVTFSVQVKPQFPAQVIPGGTVNLSEQSTSLGTVALDSKGTGVYTTTFALGTHPITATYNGDSNLTGSTSAVLNQQVVELCSGQVVTLGDDNNLADTCGTLSYALAKASIQPSGVDPFQIGFATPVITLTAPLEVISNTNGVQINLNGGCRIADGRGLPNVTLVKGAGADSTGLTLGSKVAVSGFAIAGFDDWAIEAQGANNTFACNWIGTGDGLAAGSTGGGIHLIGGNNNLGVAGIATSGNLIAGNAQAGLLIEAGSKGNAAYFNWFGSNASGPAGLANLGGNVLIQTGGQLKMGPGNRLRTG